MALSIALAHQKGGVGKTTLAMNIAGFLALQGTKVAIVDADVQGSVRDIVGHIGNGREDYAPYDVFPPNKFESYDQMIRWEEHDFIIIDTPPYISNQLPEILKHSDFCLVPCKPSPIDAIAIGATLSLLNDTRKKFGRPMSAVVLNMVNASTNFTTEIRNTIENAGAQVFDSTINNRVSYSRSLLESGSVFGSDDAKAIEEMATFCKELFARITSGKLGYAPKN